MANHNPGSVHPSFCDSIRYSFLSVGGQTLVETEVSSLVKLAYNHNYYSFENRMSRDYDNWSRSRINDIIYQNGMPYYKARSEHFVAILDPIAFFTGYLSMDAHREFHRCVRHIELEAQVDTFRSHCRQAAHNSITTTSSYSHQITSGPSQESSPSSLSSTSRGTLEDSTSRSLLPIVNPSSTSMIVHPDSDFQPSRKRLGLDRSITPERELEARRANVNLADNYEGDVTAFAIECANTPEFENCAVYIERLPVETTYQEFFNDIFEGKIFQFSWTKPDPPRHPGRSARLVFATRTAAEQYVNRGRSSGSGIYFHGQRIVVKWNARRCPPMLPSESHQTRVLHMTGPEESLDLEALIEKLQSVMEFELVSSRQWFKPVAQTVVELVFPSILGQSRQARRYLLEVLKKDEIEHLFSVRFARDPCDLYMTA